MHETMNKEKRKGGYRNKEKTDKIEEQTQGEGRHRREEGKTVVEEEEKSKKRQSRMSETIEEGRRKDSCQEADRGGTLETNQGSYRSRENGKKK